MATRLVVDVIAFRGIPLLIVSEVREADIGIMLERVEEENAIMP